MKGCFLAIVVKDVLFAEVVGFLFMDEWYSVIYICYPVGSKVWVEHCVKEKGENSRELCTFVLEYYQEAFFQVFVMVYSA